MMNNVHMIKTENPWFCDVWAGRKCFEIREDDGRGYKEGDRLILQEFDKEADKYTGRYVMATVEYSMPLSAVVRLDRTHHQHPVKVLQLRNIDPRTC